MLLIVTVLLTYGSPCFAKSPTILATLDVGMVNDKFANERVSAYVLHVPTLPTVCPNIDVVLSVFVAVVRVIVGLRVPTFFFVVRLNTTVGGGSHTAHAILTPHA